MGLGAGGGSREGIFFDCGFLIEGDSLSPAPFVRLPPVKSIFTQLDRAQSLLKDAPKRAVYRAAQRLQTGGLSLQAGLSYEHEQHGPMTLSSDGVAHRGGIPLNSKLRPE